MTGPGKRARPATTLESDAPRGAPWTGPAPTTTTTTASTEHGTSGTGGGPLATVPATREAAAPEDRGAGTPARGPARLRAHLGVPLFRNAYALIGSTVLMTGLGVVASFAAAQLYDPEAFGRGQSTVNALILLGGLGNLRLMNVLTRFLPRARERSGWLINRCYALVVAASLLACAVYLFALDGVLPVEELMGDTPYPGVWLTVAVVAFALFTLQDAVLTGLRSATWVPVKNGTHGLAKLVLVAALAGVLPSSGILASWAVPSLLALVPIQLLVRRLLPANAARPVEAEDLSVRRLAPFAAGEYGGALCELGVANLIPLIILARLGPELAGFFAVAWMIGTTLDHIVMHFGSSLTVEGASQPERLPALTRDLLRRSGLVLGPIAAVVVLGAPYLLLPFGPGFAEEAGGVLRLLGLALVPRLVCMTAVVVARVRNDVPRVVGIQALLAAGALAGSFVLLDSAGLAGPGIAYLGTSVLVALLVTPRLLSVVRGAGPAPVPGSAPPPPDGDGGDGSTDTPPAGTDVRGDPGAPDGHGATGAPPGSPRERPGRLSFTDLLPGSLARDPRTRDRTRGRPRVFTVPAARPGTRPAPATPSARRRLRLSRHRVEAASRGRGRGRALLPAAPLVAATVLAALALVRIDRSDPGGPLGLTAVLPVPWWLAAAALTAGFAALLATGPDPRTPTDGSWGPPRWNALLLAHLVGLVILLHGTMGAVGAHPRFPTAWTHIGFVDHVAATGTVDPGYDGRYNWPGGFSLGALLTGVTGADSARSLVRYTPVVINLLLLVPLALIVRHATADRRIRWMALWLFAVTNWIGQDYLAPQPVALLTYLTVVAVLLRWFRRVDTRRATALDLLGRVRRRLPGTVRDGRLVQSVAPPPPARPAQELCLVVVLTGLGAVLAFSHQLTPFVAVLATGLLVLVGRVDRPLVPVLLAVVAVAWAALGATDYLRANLDGLVAAVGNLGGVVEDNRSRLSPDPARQLVLAVRTAAVTGATVLGLAGLWRQWRARRADWALAGLAAAPVLLVGLSSYGGEIVLRVSLFSLPFLAVLGGFAFRGEHDGPRATRRAGVLFLLVAALLVPPFALARYGNEPYERIYGDDIAAWDHLVTMAPAGSTVVVPDFAGPWRYRDLTRFEYRLYADEVDRPLDAPGAVDRLDRLVAAGDQPGYLVLGTASARFREVAEGYPPGWEDDLAADLLATGRYRVDFESGDTRVLARVTGGDGVAADGAAGDRDETPAGRAGRDGEEGR